MTPEEIYSPARCIVCGKELTRQFAVDHENRCLECYEAWTLELG